MSRRPPQLAQSRRSGNVQSRRIDSNGHAFTINEKSNPPASGFDFSDADNSALIALLEDI